MTWIVGMPTMFGYSIGISDVRVTLGDGSEHDCLQKIYPVTNSIALGFAGSVLIGFQMVSVMRSWLKCENPEEQFRVPLEVAAQWPQIAKQVFAAAPKYEQESQCHLMMLSTDPGLMNGSWPQTYVHTFRSPEFEPVKAETQKAAAVGSGSFISEFTQHLDELSNVHERRFNLMRMEAGMPGGLGSVLGYQVTDLVKQIAPSGISSHLHYCWVYLGQVIIKTNDHNSYGRWAELPAGSGINQPIENRAALTSPPTQEGGVAFRMPQIAATWNELTKLLELRGSTLNGATA